jgi:hypothetical protein
MFPKNYFYNGERIPQTLIVKRVVAGTPFEETDPELTTPISQKFITSFSEPRGSTAFLPVSTRRNL